MKQEIQNIQLQFKCPAVWDQMSSTNGGRHCNQCNKTVYDFTNAKQQEFLNILAECGGSLCGRFNAQQMAPQPVALRGWKKWVSAALVFLGINIFHQQATAQKTKPAVAQAEHNILPSSFVGIYIQAEAPAEFPGGSDNLEKFLAKNIQYKPGIVNGKVLAKVIVKPDGSLKKISIVKSLNALNDAEALRVLNLMPKWQPAIRNTRLKADTVTIEVKFNKPASASK